MKIHLALGSRSALSIALYVALSVWAKAQTLDPYYQSDYNIRPVGTVPGLPLGCGGIAFKDGDPNTLLVAGNIDSADGEIYQIGLVRDAARHLTGFLGTATLVAKAPGLPDSDDGIDGGLIYAPGGGVLLYTSYKDNSLGEIKVGQNAPAKQIDLSTINIPGSVGSLVLVPPGLPGAGRLKILSFNESIWYDTTLSPDGNGTFNLAPVSQSVQLDGGMGVEGAIYVPGGRPLFPVASVLIADYNNSAIYSFAVDTNGDPLPATQRTVATDMTNAAGAAQDPVTGDFVFGNVTDGQIWIIGQLGTSAPTVRITSPADGATFGATVSVLLTAEAAQAGGRISELDFYVNGEYAGQGGGDGGDGTYTAWNKFPAAGQYTLTAVALGSGLSATSSVVRVTVTNILPNVTITSPLDGEERNECADVLLSARSVDGSGTVTNISFYLNGISLLGNAPKAPYTVSASLPLGTNSLTAVATDDTGASSTSTIVHVIVHPTPLNAISVNRLLSGATVRLCFRGSVGQSYVLESASSLLTPADWAPVSTNLAPQSTAGLITILKGIQGAEATRYYQMRQEQ